MPQANQGLGRAMVERLPLDHYFVAAETVEFSEWVDVAVADILPALTEWLVLQPAGSAFDRQRWQFGKTWQVASRTDFLAP